MRENPGTENTQKQIYALWNELNEGAWRLDDDQVKSAQKILEKLDGADVEIIPIRTEAGIHSIAFGLKEVLDGWADLTEELAMDSTCTLAPISPQNLLIVVTRENKRGRLRTVWVCRRGQG